MIFRFRKCRLKLWSKPMIFWSDRKLGSVRPEQGWLWGFFSLAKNWRPKWEGKFLCFVPFVLEVSGWVGCFKGFLDRQSTPTRWDSDLYIGMCQSWTFDSCLLPNLWSLCFKQHLLRFPSWRLTNFHHYQNGDSLLPSFPLFLRRPYFKNRQSMEGCFVDEDENRDVRWKILHLAADELKNQMLLKYEVGEFRGDREIVLAISLSPLNSSAAYFSACRFCFNYRKILKTTP